MPEQKSTGYKSDVWVWIPTCLLVDKQLDLSEAQYGLLSNTPNIIFITCLF